MSKSIEEEGIESHCESIRIASLATIGCDGIAAIQANRIAIERIGLSAPGGEYSKDERAMALELLESAVREARRGC